jgi:filamentous hemagglutinin family protein
MKQALSSLLKASFYTFCLLLSSVTSATGQITTDGTIPTEVNQNDNVTEITGGSQAGSNLFHSFKDFSIPAGNEASFNNADDIQNILSRVTGGNISNINGLIRANDANLFLINPAGIIFGEGASLDIGGSFYGSSANSILFPDDLEFSATDGLAQPVLTINAPIGLSFRDNPGEIVNQSTPGLLIEPGNTISLIGGNVSFDGGTIFAPGGRVELGGLTAPGTVNINNDGSLSFADTVARGDVSIANGAQVFVSSEDGGSIAVNAKNFALTSGSVFFAGINVGSGSPEAQAGDVVINAQEDVVIDRLDSEGQTYIANTNAGTGNAGNVEINARNISFANGGSIANYNGGEGDIGNITLKASENISFDGIKGFSQTGVTNFVAPGATGDVGEINITAQNLTLTNGAFISNQVAGVANGGDINIDVADNISIDGTGLGLTELNEGSLPSQISSDLSISGVGNSGDININTQNLSLTRNGVISASIFGKGNAGDININANLITIGEQGDTNLSPSNISAETLSGFNDTGALEANAGNITINTGSLLISDGGGVEAGIAGNGNGGNIIINARDTIAVDGTGLIFGSIEVFSDISADVFPGSIGNAGNIEIDTGKLSVTNGAVVSADTLTDTTGNGGNLTIKTEQLTLSGDASQISATTFGDGDAGSVTINASDSINLSGNSETSRSGLFASAIIGSGNGGDLAISTDKLTIRDGAMINVSNFSSRGFAEPGTGEAGDLSIEANSISLDNDILITAATQSGNGGNIFLKVADDITLRNDSTISAKAFNNANGGNLTIDTNFIIAFPDGNNDIIANAAQGTGGNINITAESLFGIEERLQNDFTNDIDASSEFGFNGNVSINTPEADATQGVTELPINVIEPQPTTTQACNANSESGVASGLTVKTKGGVPPAPDLPLNSQTISINGETVNSISLNPEPVKEKTTYSTAIATSQGVITPAMGVVVKKDGRVTLTPYPTDSTGDRIPVNSANCH